MTDQLRSALTRIAEDAHLSPPDPTLWARARRSRRRVRELTAAASVLAVLAVIAATTLGVRVLTADPSPSKQPHNDPTPAIPSSIHGLDGTGGLPLERDLGVGRASVAFANDSSVFVITAADGVYHRLELPQYDAAFSAANASAMALSPDGHTLAYAWHKRMAADKRPELDQEYHQPSGIRFVDLRTGRVSKDLPGEAGVGHTFYLSTSRQDLRWSPDGRYLTYESCGNYANYAAGAQPCSEPSWSSEVVDTRTGQTWSVDKDHEGSPDLRRPPAIVSPQGLGAYVSGDWLIFTERNRETGRVALGSGPWSSSTGLFAPDSQRIFLQPNVAGTSVLEVDAEAQTTAERQVLDAEQWPEGAHIQLLGWVGPTHVLATLQPGEDGGAQLALLDLDSAAGEATVVGEISGPRVDRLSLAANLATVDEPTRDFGETATSSGAPAAAAATDDSGRSRWITAGAAASAAVGAIVLVGIRKTRRPS
jgi:hypothetical protein